MVHYGGRALIRNNHRHIPNATRIVLKRARLWEANAGGHLEQ
jgi:hypothetical protein